MTEIGYAALGIIPSFDGFQAKLEQGSGKALVAAGTSGGAKFGDSAGKSAGKRFGMSFKKVATGLLTGYAAIKVKDFLGDSIAEARDSQKVGALTTSVIKATGKAAKVTAKQVGDLSTALSNKTGIDDEVIQSGANMLLTFKNVRNEQGKNNKIFDQATKTLVDLSAAMGTDPKQAAIQLGKALNDPLKGITALTRVGVTFDEQQKAQIKTLVQHGHTMDAQKIILRELNSEFGGAAAAQATWGEKASVAWSNFKEGVGTALLPVIDTIEKKFVREGIPELNKFSGWFSKKGLPAIEDFATEAEPVVKSILPAIGDALTKAKDAAAFIAPKLKGVFDGFNKLPDWVKTTILVGAGSAAVAKKIGGFKLGANILGKVTGGGVQKVFVVNEGFGGVGGVPGKGGKVAGLLGTAGKVAVPVAIVAASAVALKNLWDWNHSGDKNKASSMTGGKIGDWSRKTFGGSEKKKIDDATASVLRQRDAWSKVRDDFENGTKKAQILSREIMGIGTRTDQARDKADQLHGRLSALPGTAQTKIEAPGLLEALTRAYQLRSIYAGLDRDVTTNIITNHINKFERMTGHPGVVGATGGIVRRPTVALIGEAGPEAVVPLNRTPGNSPLPVGRASTTQRVVLDFGAGRTLTGWIQDEVHSDATYRRTTGRHN